MNSFINFSSSRIVKFVFFLGKEFDRPWRINWNGENIFGEDNLEGLGKNKEQSIWIHLPSNSISDWMILAFERICQGHLIVQELNIVLFRQFGKRKPMERLEWCGIEGWIRWFNCWNSWLYSCKNQNSHSKPILLQRRQKFSFGNL